MDVEGTMQFILEQRAQFASDIQQIKEILRAQQEQFAQFNEHFAQIREHFNQVNAVLLDVATSQQNTNEIVAVLAERIVDLTTLVNRHIASHN